MPTADPLKCPVCEMPFGREQVIPCLRGGVNGAVHLKCAQQAPRVMATDAEHAALVGSLTAHMGTTDEG